MRPVGEIECDSAYDSRKQVLQRAKEVSRPTVENRGSDPEEVSIGGADKQDDVMGKEQIYQSDRSMPMPEEKVWFLPKTELDETGTLYQADILSGAGKKTGI